MRLIKNGSLWALGAFAVAAVTTAAYYIGALVIRLSGWSHQGQVLFTGCE
jgi:hypothetical protein